MHAGAFNWVSECLAMLGDHSGWDVLEIGSLNVNGTVRGLLEGCRSYTGVDRLAGPGVDVVSDIRAFTTSRKFDLVLCCEVLEHDPQPREIVDAAGRWLKPGGFLILTAAGPNREPHSVDGGRLRDGEHYGNIAPQALLRWLEDGWHEVWLDYLDQIGDVYVKARRQGRFLSIVTRHMLSRPALYERHLQSLLAQTDRNFEQVLIVDETGNGLRWANEQFAVHAGRVTGDYVLLLDDDDVLAEPDAVAALRAAVRVTTLQETAPDIVMFRCDCGPGVGILPDGVAWQKRPVLGHVGGSCFIVRNEVWQRHIGMFAQPSGGDYHFLEALWRDEYAKTWLDRVLVRVQQTGQGRPE